MLWLVHAGTVCMSTILAQFQHRFEPATATGAARPPLLLLHGTGGNEDDLIPLGREVAPGAALLAPRGQVLEGNMPRFFRRLAEGVFDEDDLRVRTDELAAFVAAARAEHDLAAPIAVGYSNGANIAASLLLQCPGVLAGAALLRAMPPYRQPPDAELGGTPVLLLAGERDTLIPLARADELAGQLSAAGARVNQQTLPGGHRIGTEDAHQLAAWLAEPPANN